MIRRQVSWPLGGPVDRLRLEQASRCLIRFLGPTSTPCKGWNRCVRPVQLFPEGRGRSSHEKFYGTITVNSPGVTKLITPAHMHMLVETLSRVGILPSITVAAPGTQGLVVMGMQGMGVRTPMAAAVAAATIGFAGDIHMPKGMIFTRGM